MWRAWPHPVFAPQLELFRSALGCFRLGTPHAAGNRQGIPQRTSPTKSKVLPDSVARGLLDYPCTNSWLCIAPVESAAWTHAAGNGYLLLGQSRDSFGRIVRRCRRVGGFGPEFPVRIHGILGNGSGSAEMYSARVTRWLRARRRIRFKIRTLAPKRQAGPEARHGTFPRHRSRFFPGGNPARVSKPTGRMSRRLARASCGEILLVEGDGTSAGSSKLWTHRPSSKDIRGDRFVTQGDASQERDAPVRA